MMYDEGPKDKEEYIQRVVAARRGMILILAVVFVVYIGYVLVKGAL